MSSLKNTAIRIPSDQKNCILLKIKDRDGVVIDLKGTRGFAIIGQGNDKRVDYRELKLRKREGLLAVYFPPMSPGEYRIKLKLERDNKLLTLQEFRVIVVGAYDINPSSRNFGVTNE